MGDTALRCLRVEAALLGLLWLLRGCGVGALPDLPWPLFVPKPTAPSSVAPDPSPGKGLGPLGWGADTRDHWEVRDGDAVRGSYSVVQPDGSIVSVEYTSDGSGGYRATIKRDGIFGRAPTDLGQVPLYLALKPLLAALPTATSSTTTTTTTAAPTDKSKWPNLAAIDDFHKKFWDTYGTPLYGADRNFFDKPFFPFYKSESTTTAPTTTASTTEKPPAPIYVHVDGGGYAKQPPVYYYWGNAKPSYADTYHGYPHYWHDHGKPAQPFYYHIGSASHDYAKTDITDAVFAGT